MKKRIAWSLAVAVAFLVSSAAIAADTPTHVSEEVFLATLQEPAAEAAPEAPAKPNLDNSPEPIFMALPSCTSTCRCTYQCQKCTSTSVKLCAVNCNGQSGCDSCKPGTVCAI